MKTFNNTPNHFEPSDILKVPSGVNIGEALKNSDFDFLLQNKKLLKSILFYNGLLVNGLTVPVKQQTTLLLNHPKMYDQRYRDHACYHPYRNRSFSFFEEMIIAAEKRSRLHNKTNCIENIKKQNHSDFRILEVGIGSGRALLELQRDLPNSNCVGICLPGESVDLREVSDFFELHINSKSKMPQIIEVNLNEKTLFQTYCEQVDFIFSQATFRYIRDKSIFLQNVHSLLRTGGRAVIQLGLMNIEDKQGHSISLSDFFNQPQWQDEFYFDSNTSLLFVSKISTSPIDFCLSLNDKKSKYANPNPDPTQNKNVGWQSYYTWAQNEQ